MIFIDRMGRTERIVVKGRKGEGREGGKKGTEMEFGEREKNGKKSTL